MKYVALIILMFYTCFSNAQHTVYPDLFIIGSDSLEEGEILDYTAFIFDIQNKGFSGGIKLSSGQLFKPWHRDSIGFGSFAYGFNARASDSHTIAFGQDAIASGPYAISIGPLSKADGDLAVAIGPSARAAGNSAVALGRSNVAHGESSLALGRQTLSSGEFAASFGYKSNALAKYSVAMGHKTIATDSLSMVIGEYNDDLSSEGYFVIGNGSSDADRSNAMIVDKDGKMGLGEDHPEGYMHIRQPNSVDAPQLTLTGDGGDSFVRIEVNRSGIDKSWFHSVTTNASDANSFYSFAYQPDISINSFTFPIRMDGNGHTAFGKLPGTNRIEVNGDASKTTAGDWLANSDLRIKTEIKDIKNSFELLEQLRPVKFKYSEEWKRKNPSIKDQYYYNFIAQEYQEVFPESVQGSGEYLESDNKEILQIDTYNAQIMTIAAVKELIKENARLSRELTRLNQENAQIKEETNVLHEKYESLETRVYKMMNQQSGTKAEQ